MDDQQVTETTEKKTAKPGFVRRYGLILAAVILGLVLIGGASYYAFGRETETVAGDFDPSSVLPAPVSQPESTAVYTAETLKQYDGKDGRRCYAAVDGTVYEISGKSLWQEGQHTPSAGDAYCGADLTEALKRSPHGASKLRDLPKVGTYK